MQEQYHSEEPPALCKHCEELVHILTYVRTAAESQRIKAHQEFRFLRRYLAIRRLWAAEQRVIAAMQTIAKLCPRDGSEACLEQDFVGHINMKATGREQAFNGAVYPI